jgi:hypothetical protein
MYLLKTLMGQNIMHDEQIALNSGVASKLTFAPAGRLVSLGAKEVIAHRNLWKLPQDFQAGFMWEQFSKHWDVELTK